MCRANPVPVPCRPALALESVREIAREEFGLKGALEALPGERDQHFRIAAADGTPRSDWVIKIAPRGTSRDELDMQVAALRHVATCGTPVPEPRSSGTGAAIVEADGLLVRVVSWIDGTPLAAMRPHTGRLLKRVGRAVGAVDAALSDFGHRASSRVFHWDLRHALAMIDTGLSAIDDAKRRALVERFVKRFEDDRSPLLGDLRTGVIHNDANDHNVLIDARLDGPRVAGLIDFGDMVHTWLAADAAITMAYAMLDKDDPLGAGAAVASGFHDALPLTEHEADALDDLVRLRLCASVANSARARRAHPDDPYVVISERPAWALLEQLETAHPRFAAAVFRNACGFAVTPEADAVTSWIGAHTARMAPIVDADLSTAIGVNLSVGSATLATMPGGGTDAEFDAYLDQRQRETGAEIVVGHYDEARLVYTTDAFAEPALDRPERRTVHLGLDLFAAAGTAVQAPLDGVVHAVRDNDTDRDYGPTVILRHEPDGCPAFFTLYGHLGRTSVADLEPGDAVKRGARFAALGAAHENGGWSPHLHFQIVLDMLDRDGEFPGVAAPHRRAVWCGLSPQPSLVVTLPPEARRLAPVRGDDIIIRRQRALGPSLSVSYARPLTIVRGLGAELFDDDGRAYLDGVNNVCHVGHCHPRTVRAAHEQMAVLNTNTRYLHPRLVEYAERLAATLPSGLDVVYLVNSGSEANELALRLAETHTGRRGVIALDGAYHGNTRRLIDISAYKHAGPGGHGAPEHVRVVPLPDPYRGLHRGPECGIAYAAHVDDAAREAEIAVGAFIAESMPGCGGQIILPSAYLRAAHAHARAHGAVCIADEVQTGFGRAGSRFWAFQTQGDDVVPDIVTMGKPIGNGHPIGAVVTTRAIAESFQTGMEYFNTFGGNPVSCAVGMAVLDVIEDEGLQARAERVGRLLLERVKRLADAHERIGDVRGCGLFAGIELVLDREARTPAPDHAAAVVERLRDRGILLSTDGPDHNVIKIKPPLCFSAEHVAHLADTLESILDETAFRS